MVSIACATGWCSLRVRSRAAALTSPRPSDADDVVINKLLTDGHGCGVKYGDMPLVRSIVKDAEASQFRFSSVIFGIVKSPAFQMNMKTTEPTEQRATR